MQMPIYTRQFARAGWTWPAAGSGPRPINCIAQFEAAGRPSPEDVRDGTASVEHERRCDPNRHVSLCFLVSGGFFFRSEPSQPMYAVTGSQRHASRPALLLVCLPRKTIVK